METNMRTGAGWWRILGAAAALAGCGGTPVGDLSIDASPSFDATTVEDSGVGAPAPPQPSAGRVTPRDAARPEATTEGGTDAGARDDEDASPADASADATADGPATVVGPPQSGPFLDGSCPYDASFSADGDTTLPGDAGAPDAHVPDSHRPSALCCPVDRDPGSTCAPDAAVPPIACFGDSDCNKGTNGRCVVYPGTRSASGGAGFFIDGCSSECTYDECFSDVDCPGHVPCDCRVFGYGTNVCRTGSRCSVDSDCGPGGFCSQDLSNLYYCHRPGDVCFNDRDCQQGEFGARCRFNTDTSQWQCFGNPPPP
jgi:hypothetical protein